MHVVVSDEGGFAPSMQARNEAARARTVRTIARTGFRPGIHLLIAVDPTVSSVGLRDRYALHCRGKAEDTFIAAVAVAAGQIKSDSMACSEGLAKYNRLLEVKRGLGDAAQFVNSDGGYHGRWRVARSAARTLS